MPELQVGTAFARHAPVDTWKCHAIALARPVHGIRELPGTLGEALDELEKDEVIRDALGAHVFSHFTAAKREEWDEYRTQVSDWEIDRYLDAY